MTETASPIEGVPLAGYIRQAQLIPGIIPFSSPTLWRMVKAGKFPTPVKLSARVTAWRIDEVRAWLAERDPAEALHSADHSARASREASHA